MSHTLLVTFVKWSWERLDPVPPARSAMALATVLHTSIQILRTKRLAVFGTHRWCVFDGVRDSDVGEHMVRRIDRALVDLPPRRRCWRSEEWLLPRQARVYLYAVPTTAHLTRVSSAWHVTLLFVGTGSPEVGVAVATVALVAVGDTGDGVRGDGAAGGGAAVLGAG